MSYRIAGVGWNDNGTMATKELTPLEAFRKLIEVCEEYHLKFSKVKPTTIEGYPIENIEKALKALEIIKETPEFAWYVKIYNNACEMVNDVKGFRVNNSVEELQEMFDLLKEVLS